MGRYTNQELEVYNLPVLPFAEVKPPFVICVAMGRTSGVLEANVAFLGLRECADHWHFN